MGAVDHPADVRTPSAAVRAAVAKATVGEPGGADA